MKVPVLRISDNKGNIIPIPAIKGENGIASVLDFYRENGSQTVVRFNNGLQVIVGQTEVDVSERFIISNNFTSGFVMEKTSLVPLYNTFEFPFTDIYDCRCEYRNDSVKNALSIIVKELDNSHIFNFEAVSVASEDVTPMSGYVFFTVFGRWK